MFFFIIVGQVIIIQFGGDAIKISRGGLHWVHWLIAVILGITNWIMALLFKFIPDSWIPQFGAKKTPEGVASRNQILNIASSLDDKESNGGGGRHNKEFKEVKFMHRMGSSYVKDKMRRINSSYMVSVDGAMSERKV